MVEGEKMIKITSILIIVSIILKMHFRYLVKVKNEKMANTKLYGKGKVDTKEGPHP